MTEIGLRVLQLAWLMAPAYAANMAPPFLRYWRGWNPPLQRRLFGAHKTVLGFAAGVLAALAVARLQARVGWTHALVAPSEWAAAGLALGFGAMAGDAVKSFFKRRRGRPPGTPWPPFDQLDFVVGALLLVAPRVELGAADVALTLAATFVGDLLVNRAAFRLGIKDTPW
ncbi:CDP-archaeol synthase [Mizugakiibacter sediminis]|nr:CDP-archaeol synthase [Mizugakiibacter sediminis]